MPTSTVPFLEDVWEGSFQADITQQNTHNFTVDDLPSCSLRLSLNKDLQYTLKPIAVDSKCVV